MKALSVNQFINYLHKAECDQRIRFTFEIGPVEMTEPWKTSDRQEVVEVESVRSASNWLRSVPGIQLVDDREIVSAEGTTGDSVCVSLS
jgi:hypothetical protein